MENILKKIIERKILEVREAKIEFPTQKLKDLKFYKRESVSLKASLLNESSSGIIAEFKRKSPSFGEFTSNFDISEIVKGYELSGVSGVSILTDETDFGGAIEDIINTREILNCPILRKEFIVDEYQIEESKAIGADVILIIASALDKNKAKELSHKAKELGLEVLLEVHDLSEIESHLNPYTDFIGVNNRNLKTLKTNIEASFSLAEKIPNEFIKISESGITNPETIKKLNLFNYKGFLIGESFLRTENPISACEKFVESLKSKN